MGSNREKVSLVRVCALVVTIAMSLLAVVAISGCSNEWQSGGQGEEQTVNGYSVAEYNSDVDELSAILAEARSLYNRIEAMDDSAGPSTNEEVQEYNSFVEQYNEAADRYNAAAKAFVEKYGEMVDGAGSDPCDPYAIQLPSKRDC
ncbi:hypothetical protein GMI70_04635 [Eggerthellaceae bacterium zg-893]|nr:hypothetical protein [Eggerthellaceae bacterium zg-893]